MRIVIAGVGNLLRGDDGFGVAVAHRLSQNHVPPQIDVLDIGIGGIHLVQEMLDRVNVLIIVDAVDLGRTPGTVLVMHPDVRDVSKMTGLERRDELADMHYATPARALMLAQGLGLLPDQVWLVGCQPVDADRLGEGLSQEVADAIPLAIREIHRIVRDVGIEWTVA